MRTHTRARFLRLTWRKLGRNVGSVERFYADAALKKKYVCEIENEASSLLFFFFLDFLKLKICYRAIKDEKER